MAALAPPPPAARRVADDEADAAGALLSSLSLGAKAAPVLAWDALNYLRQFLDEQLMRRDPWAATRALEARVAEFAVAAAHGGFRPSPSWTPTCRAPRRAPSGAAGAKPSCATSGATWFSAHMCC